MRILKVTQSYYPFVERGGPALKVRALARALHKLGNEVTVLTADLGFGSREIALINASAGPDAWRSNAEGIEAIYLRTRGHYRNMTVNPGALGFCRQRLKDFDIVHTYGLYDTLGPAVGRYCRRFDVPYVLEPLGMTRPIDRGIFLKKIWKGVASRYLRGARRWIATSELERSELHAEGIPAEKVLLRFNGIDREEFKNLPAFGAFRKSMGIANDDRMILFLGRLIPRKGADLLIEAVAKIRSEKIKLVIAGPESESGYLKILTKKAQILEIGQNVVFPGPLYGQARLQAFVDATVFVLPSRYENFGNTAAEAIACGTPVVVTNRCGIAPLVDHRAGLVTLYDVRALAAALADVLGIPQLYQCMKAACPEVAAELSWDRLAGQMQNLYLEILGQGKN